MVLSQLIKPTKWLGITEINHKLIDPKVKRCYSPNLYKWFSKVKNRKCCNVIRHKGKLWFAIFYENGKEWVGTEVLRVACQPQNASIGWHTSQNKYGYEDVTEWFWTKFLEEGMYGHYEIWRRQYPKQLTHKEHSTI